MSFHPNLLASLTAAICLCCPPALGAEQRISCPTVLAPDAIQARHPPTGWSLHMPQDVNLTEGGMLQGAPDQSAYMVPSDSKSSTVGKQVMQTMYWTFPAPQGDEMWMYCGYGGAGAPLRLFTRVAGDVTQCTLSSRSSNGQIKDEVTFLCK